MPRFARRLLLRLALLILLALSALAAYEWLTWPDVPVLAAHDPSTTAFIERYRQRAEKAGMPAPEWQWVSYRRISPEMKQAAILAEDQEFFSHDGFSLHEMKAAVLNSVLHRKPLRGASTITQQLAKNLWLQPSRNPWLKVKEALLTRQLERSLDKRRILELYLNVVEFGPGVYGAEAAARRYFGKPAAALEPHEAAALAAGLPRPRHWHPGSSHPEYLARSRRLLQNMDRSTWILDQL